MKARTRLLLEQLSRRWPALQSLESDVVAAFEMICRGHRGGHILYTCGNGGSAADSEHIVGELLKGFLEPRRLCQEDRQALERRVGPEEAEYLGARLQYGVRAVALTGHPALSSAVANDTAPELIFAQQLYVLGRPGDILVALSTSGNSVNVVRAAQVARAGGMGVIAFTGQHGGQLARLADVTLAAPSLQTFEVQEYHLPLYHTICAMVEHEEFGGQ